MDKFKLFLEDKGKKFLKKNEIQNYYEEFKSLWKLEFPFEKVMDSLRKTSLTYLFDDYWAISKENPLKLSLEFMVFLGVESYYGLSSALYFNKIIWQPQLNFKLLNTKYNKKRTINGITIEFIKIPREIYNKETLVFEELTYSNYEKTILDMIFFDLQIFYEPKDFERLNLYLSLFNKYPEVRSTLIEKLSFDKRRLIR